MPARPPEPPDFAASQLFLRRLAFHLVRDAAQAEDLVQETWATWVERRPKGLAEPRAWLARVLRNRAFNLKRGDERRARHEELAGRPDPSAPETDGTLEAQAQLLEALRKLEEPYRSTLVQRYYHDLSPSAIAERAGTPLNTVKARLARGLEKLRGDMDRRYHGDRRAWCHWLTVVGAPPVPVGIPGAPGGAAPAAGSTSGGAILAWCGVAAALVAAGVWRSGWRSEPRPPEPPAVATEPERPAEVSRIGRTESSREEPAGEDTSARENVSRTEASLAALGYGPEPEPGPDVRAAGPVRERFDWPQYGGGPTHNNYRARDDEIHAPKVLWFVPGCAGQPTLDGEDLFTGGLTLARLDARTGVLIGVGAALLMEALGFEDAALPDSLQVFFSQLDSAQDAALDAPDVDLAEMAALGTTLQRLQAQLEGLEGKLETLDWNDTTLHRAAGSPVLTSKHVLIRHARDGSVIAFDRQLRKEDWRWESGWDERVTDSAYTRVPLCVTEEDVVLVPLHSELIALRAKDGRELWRYSVNGAIEMVPASADGRVFFGTDRGLFLALSIHTGDVLWRAGGDELAPVAPVVVGGRVLAVTQQPSTEGDPRKPKKLRAWDARTGAATWDHELYGPYWPGMGVGESGREVVFTMELGIAKVNPRTGKSSFLFNPEGLPRGTPVVVGQSLVFADTAGNVSVHDIESGVLRWTFRLPEDVRVTDLVHSGRRLYVATSIGLFCIADDEERAAVEPGFVLAWGGDRRLPSYLADEKK